MDRKTYVVHARMTAFGNCIVQAESPEQAKDIAGDMLERAVDPSCPPGFSVTWDTDIVPTEKHAPTLFFDVQGLHFADGPGPDARFANLEGTGLRVIFRDHSDLDSRGKPTETVYGPF